MFIKKTVGYVTVNNSTGLSTKLITTKASHNPIAQNYIEETIDSFFEDLSSEYLFRTQVDYLDSYYKSIFEMQKGENRLATPRKPRNNIEETVNSSLTGKRKSVYTNIQNYITKNPNLSEQGIVSELDKMLNESKHLLTDQTAKYRSTAVLDAMKDEGYEKFVFNSSNSEGTCELCSEMDGKTFNLNEVESGINCPPLHPNCQCSISPDLGFHVDLNFLLDYDDWVIKYLADNRDVSFYLNQLLKGYCAESSANTDGHPAYSFEQKMNVKEQLNKLIDQQFRLFAPKEITMNIPGMGEVRLDANNILSSLFDKRLVEVLNTLEQNKNLIHRVSSEFGIPAEVIGSVILREQYCEKVPDSIIVALEHFGRKGGSVGWVPFNLQQRVRLGSPTLEKSKPKCCSLKAILIWLNFWRRMTSLTLEQLQRF